MSMPILQGGEFSGRGRAYDQIMNNNFFRLNAEDAAAKIADEIQKRHQDNNKCYLVAIDGQSGTGKSTLAKLVAEKVNGIVVNSDDFYSGGNDDRWKECSPQEKVDLVIDWKKLRYEILEPLIAGKSASWHPLEFLHKKGWVGWKKELVQLEPKSVVILEGAYSARPEFLDMIDLAILIQATDTMRRRQLQEREGEAFMKQWHEIWDEAEEYYFSKISPKSGFDLVIQLF